jgi:hypothetical protein
MTKLPKNSNWKTKEFIKAPWKLTKRPCIDAWVDHGDTRCDGSLSNSILEF